MGLYSVERDDIWEAFDSAVERVESALDQARTNYAVIERTDEPLPEVYGVALAELDEKVETFDSVYNVTDSELETAESAAIRAEFLAAVTDAYRQYHETVTERRAEIVGKRFDAMEDCIEQEDVDIAADQSAISRQITALRKLADAGKYAQLQESDRVNLQEVESVVEELDEATREAVSIMTYVSVGRRLAESLKDEYTNDLSELVNSGIDAGAISVSDQAREAPDLDSIDQRAQDGDLTAEDTAAIATTIEIFTDIALSTRIRKAKYELGRQLISVLEDSPLIETSDIDLETLRESIETLDCEPIETEVAALVEGEATTSEAERLVQLLAEHDGSVRRTIDAADRPVEDIFDDLETLLENGEISDIEVVLE